MVGQPIFSCSPLGAVSPPCALWETAGVRPRLLLTSLYHMPLSSPFRDPFISCFISEGLTSFLGKQSVISDSNQLPPRLTKRQSLIFLLIWKSLHSGYLNQLKTHLTHTKTLQMKLRAASLVSRTWKLPNCLLHQMNQQALVSSSSEINDIEL